MKVRDPITLLRLYHRSKSVIAQAESKGIPGMEFARYGRKLGCKLIPRYLRMGLMYLLNPVDSTRYFEFHFAQSCLSGEENNCLDVSSPRLFSLYLAERRPEISVTMMNPDQNDLDESYQIISLLGLQGVRVQVGSVDQLSDTRGKYDCIWSLSVIEHISGDYGDTHAVKLMYDALKEGGKLILTVPVDRKIRDEYRDRDCYGTKPEAVHGKYFFQRIYDKTAIWERVISPIGEEPSIVRWFGETTGGIFVDYEQSVMRRGFTRVVDGPGLIADHFREFSNWEDMKGMGVCGLLFEKSSHSSKFLDSKQDVSIDAGAQVRCELA